MPDPTPYPGINALLHLLLAGVQAVLGDRFAGLYLYGSLAAGEFDPARSDIDFLVATTAELPAGLVPTLAAMHERIAAASPRWAAMLEGSYIPLDALRRYDPAHAVHPHLTMGDGLHVEHHGADGVILRHVLREWGIVLAGPPPHTLIDPVTPADLRRAVVDLFHSWWAPVLDDFTRIHPPAYQAYAVLTMCRILYTFHHGAVVPKPAAARWAQAALGSASAPLIDRALAWRPGDPFDHLPQTLDLIRLARDRISGA
jgi:hypothetical protein